MNRSLEGINPSIQYLSSPQALDMVRADPYWPKWHSPWWHILLLHEMGEVRRVPERMILEYVASLNRMPLKTFPIHEEDLPAGIDPFRGTSCHCQIGNIYQALFGWGLDVDREAPWLRSWLLRYQMRDGGLNCDNGAYLVENECPSSMVGTIAAFEAILLCTPRAWTPSEQLFLERAAGFLVGRKLKNGSTTVHNASEQESAKDWFKLCFPRFYLYDVLRGLTALLTWSEKTGQAIPRNAIEDVVLHLDRRFPNGKVEIDRKSFAGISTLLPGPSGEWLRGQQATIFPLLNEVSEIGIESPYLTRKWQLAKNQILRADHLKSLLNVTMSFQSLQS